MGARPTLQAIFSVALVLMSPAPAFARDERIAIDLPAGPLANALRALSVRTRVGLLFAPETIGSRRSPRVSGKMTVEEALHRLLQGSGLSFRRTDAGTIIIYAQAEPAEEAEPAVPEILVTGRRTQNADIRRTENDIQPYQVFTANEVATSHADNVDQFLRTRLPSNAEYFGPAQDPSNSYASNRSEANLHGLGASQTLMLIDGARMPGIPNISNLAMEQPDVNGVPLLAIDRIETITATAGGIYGPGATGGVINLVLKRDYRGADLVSTYGISSRGDSARRRIDGRIGFTPDHGRTNAMLTFSHMTSDALPAGYRDYAVKSRDILIGNDALAFVSGYPTINGILVRSASGGNLTLSPALGGASLGASYTYVPFSADGSLVNAGAAALANAGRTSSALAPDASGATRNLTTSTEINSVLFNLRHSFSDNIEVFADFLGYQNNSHAIFASSQQTSMFPGGAFNPFGQGVTLVFPIPGFDAPEYSRLRTFRASAGAIVKLPRRWRAEAHYSLGAAHQQMGATFYIVDSAGFLGMLLGQPAAPGEPILNPFGDWNVFVATMQKHRATYSFDFDMRDTFKDASLRLAGPLARLPAGDLSLSLLGEQRKEHVPTLSTRQRGPGFDLTGRSRGYFLTVSSLYGELRAPLVPRSAGPWPLRGLELQLAVRYDNNATQVPLGTSDWQEVDKAGVAYTGGLKLYPHDRLMLRASMSTGTLPPTPAQLIPQVDLYNIPYLSDDPRRGGRTIGSEGNFTLSSRGSLNLRTERARSISFGFVVNPDSHDWPRLSVDFTRIEKHNEIFTMFGGSAAFFLANEALFPGRITRLPLAPADAALGFTGGVITAIDASYLNIGRTWSDTVDFSADYTAHFGGAGNLRVYGLATWQPRLDRFYSPDRPVFSYVGRGGGPLRLRGNAGLEWTGGSASLGLNGQYYAPYYAVDYTNTVTSTTLSVANLAQAGAHIPPQFYLDLSAGYRLNLDRGLMRALDFRFGIVNLLDHSPPVTTNTALGYSFYGDPRRRRFELRVGAHF